MTEHERVLLAETQRAVERLIATEDPPEGTLRREVLEGLLNAVNSKWRTGLKPGEVERLVSIRRGIEEDESRVGLGVILGEGIVAR